ncbi:MAG: response regulator transcription factor [Arachnia sp.]
MIKVGICDDDPTSRAGLGNIVTRHKDLDLVASVSSGEEAVAYGGGVDVWLMDVRMRGMSGVEACARLLTAERPPKVIMVTAFPDSRLAEAVKAGAIGFLYKDARPAHLVHAIRTAALGLAVGTPEAVAKMAEEPLMGAVTPDALDTIVQDPTDARLAALIVQGHPTDVMAAKLGLSESGVKKRLRILMDRAGVSSRPLLMARLFAVSAARGSRA